jgi:Helix-turn-helix domain
MATITPLKTTPHTRIENSIIDNMAEIGVYGYAIYSMIKRHLNQKTSQCNPSYATIARKIGIDRGTVIRYVKRLKALNLISPMLRFKEDGSPTSNQYNFSPASTPSSKDEPKEGSGTEPPPLVAEDNPGSSTAPPEQSLLPNKKERTIAEVDLMPTEKQKSCPHPRSEIVFLADSITICHHCYGLLDENLQLMVDEDTPPENHHAEGDDTSEAA